ncbi:hypothetical protein [Pedobacter sandarakinus]|uniref:hypothetical protein n=1 Tax=Pedobacter sandarakinus TaxID=353156 RepID=UPI002245C230|nr:hypothetical protein [Pedobacter sandarakinus]MCX2575947.1 hypothetical protein [Pedobacter sandarakinus]
MNTIVSKIKINPINFAVISFVILLTTAITPAFYLSKNIFSINLYYIISAFIILITINALVAFIRVSDLGIPNHLKMMHFFGLFYNLSRADYKIKVSEIIKIYGKSTDEKKSIIGFLSYSTIHFYFLFFAYFIAFSSIIILILYAISSQQFFLIPFSLLLVAVISYCCYTIYNATFSKSLFANVSFAFKNIKEQNFNIIETDVQQSKFIETNFNDYSANPIDNNKIISEKVVNKEIKSFGIEEELFKDLFTKKFKEHIDFIINSLTELGYFINGRWGHKKKYVARFIFEEFVKLKVMKDFTHAKAGRCFNSKFENISIAGFEDKIEDTTPIRIEVRENVKSDLKLIVSKLENNNFI